MGITKRDINQITSYEHDEVNDAKRVIVVGSDMSGVAQTIKDSLSDGLKNLKVEFMPQNQHENVTKIERIEVPVIVRETQVKTVEVPTIIKEVEVKVIEIPRIVTDTRIEKVEVPVVVKETLFVDRPVVVEKVVMSKETMFMRFALVGQMIIIIQLIIFLMLKMR